MELSHGILLAESQGLHQTPCILLTLELLKINGVLKTFLAKFTLMDQDGDEKQARLLLMGHADTIFPGIQLMVLYTRAFA